MGNLGELAASADDVWTTPPEVAEFLGISRQAINKRVQSRKMLGYPGDGVTVFPVWQFDLENHRVRREVPEFLAAFDEGIEPHAIAQWSITRIDDSERTPVDLLLGRDSKKDALRLAGDYVVAPSRGGIPRRMPSRLHGARTRRSQSGHRRGRDRPARSTPFSSLLRISSRARARRK